MNEQTKNGAPEVQLDCWALVELFGHQKISGKIKTVSLAGGAMLRVDVPTVKDKEGYTRFYGAGAIYSISPITEELATALVSDCCSEPVKRYQIPKQLTAGESEEHEDPVF